MSAAGTMRRIGFDEAEIVAKEHLLVPVEIRGTSVLRFAKETSVPLSEKLIPIDWPAFAAIARERGVAVFESGGWLKIMRADEDPEGGPA